MPDFNRSHDSDSEAPSAGGQLIVPTGSFIALFVPNKIIRLYAGDFLVTLFRDCLAQSLLTAPPKKVALIVLLTTYLVEALPYVNLCNGWAGSIREWRVSCWAAGLSGPTYWPTRWELD